MRILLSCLQSAVRHAIPAYAFWRRYFVEGLREVGHEVVEVPGLDWAEGLTLGNGEAATRWRARTWETVDGFVRKEHAEKPIDLFLSYLYPSQVDAAAIQELHRRGIPCVNFFCDNVREFLTVPTEFRPFALHWVPEFEALPMYRRAGLPHIHAAMPCWVPPGYRTVPVGETEPPTFIGSMDVLRRDLLARALNSGADFMIRGVGWQTEAGGVPQLTRSLDRIVKNQIDLIRDRGWLVLLRKIESILYPLKPADISVANLGGMVSEAYYDRLIREAMVTIGVNRVPSPERSLRRPLVYSRLRDIEAPMLGACYLTEWTEGLEQLYDLGNEVESYRTPEELRDKLTALRRDPARRADMRGRSQRRALGDHGVARSVARIGSTLGL